MVDLSTRFKTGMVNDLLRAKKAIRKLKQEQSKIFIPSLGDPQFWQIIMFSDANLSDGVSSMGAHIVFLVGTGNSCCPLPWTANKIKRVVRSTIAAEALSLQEGLEDAIFLRSLIE